MQRQEPGAVKSQLFCGVRGALRFRSRTMRKVGLLLMVLVWGWGVVNAEAKLDYNVKFLWGNAWSSSWDNAPLVVLNTPAYPRVPDAAGRVRDNTEPYPHGFAFCNGDFTDLGVDVIPVKISNQQVVGGTKETYTKDQYGQRTFVRSDVFRWNNAGGMKLLDNLGGNSRAYGMNNQGAVVGTSFDGSANMFGCLWEPGKPIAKLARAITPTAINLSNQVVVNVLAYNQAALLEGQTYTYLGFLPGTVRNYGRAINDSGQVVGTSTNSSGISYGFIWDKQNKIKPLDPSGSHPSDPKAINNNGQVVGTAKDPATGRTWGFFWSKETGLVELNECIDRIIYPGWYFSYACDINDRGEIIGVGEYQGTTCAFLLQPATPGPGGTAASALGILLLGEY